jgi:predicted Fe-Mo cluster-binding NifX family protein
MLAIPMNKLGETPLMSEYFGKSKWFAIIDDGVISFEKNVHVNGCKIVDWLYDLGVTQTFVNFIGISPFEKLKKMDIECLYSPEHLKSLTEILDIIESNKATKVDNENFSQVVDFSNGCQDKC